MFEEALLQHLQASLENRHELLYNNLNQNVHFHRLRPHSAQLQVNFNSKIYATHY